VHSNPFQLNNEVALITGGGTGLGFGIAQCMVQAGARVVLVGRRAEPLDEAIAKLGEKASRFIHDVTDFDTNVDLVSKIEEEVGELSILVNNAGVHLKKPAIDTTEEEFSNVIHTHIMGSFSLSRAVAPNMIKRGRGSIIMIASMTSYMGMTQVVAYSATKSSYLGLINSLTAEWSEQGIRINGIAPG